MKRWKTAAVAALIAAVAAAAPVMAAVPQAQTETKQDAAAGQQSGPAYVFQYGENSYAVGMDAQEAMKTLGEEKSARDVNTCANGYINKAYTYGEAYKDFEVYVEQDESGKDRIASITLLTANVATAEGLKVGDEEARIAALYPAATKGLASYKVQDGAQELYIRVSKGAVSYISYTQAK